MPPQDMPLWHKDYLELKAVEKRQTQEKFSALFPPPRRTEDVNPKKQGPTSISPESSQMKLHNFTNSPLTSTKFPQVFTFPQFTATRSSKLLSFISFLFYKFTVLLLGRYISPSSNHSLELLITECSHGYV